MHEEDKGREEEEQDREYLVPVVPDGVRIKVAYQVQANDRDPGGKPAARILFVSLTARMLVMRMRARRMETTCLPIVPLSRNGKSRKRRPRLARRQANL
jgi:hypothetical protein